MADPADSGRLKEYIDWAVRGIVVGLLTATMATARWAVNTEQRIHDLEAINTALASEVTALKVKDDGYQQIRTDIAVIKTQLDLQGKQQERIEVLLTKLTP